MSGRGWEAHQYVREWLRGPPGGPVGIEMPTQRFGRIRDAHPEVR